MVVAPGVDVGMVFVFALSSVAVYGVILGGWSDNHKYRFLDGLRPSAQLIAYELPLGLGLLGVSCGRWFFELGDDYRETDIARMVCGYTAVGCFCVLGSSIC